jgi:hypothetical protein
MKQYRKGNMMTDNILEFDNGFTLQVALDGEKFMGIGEVTYQGTPLRSPQLPWTFYAESDTGVCFEDFVLDEVKQDGCGVTITLTAAGRWMPRNQQADSMGDSRIKPRRLKKPTATFRWSFRPITEAVFENMWTGLAMRIEADCPGHPIHWLIEDTTWEIGGEAAGCTLIQQDVSAINSDQEVEADSVFSTIEKFVTETTEGSTESCPLDMLPRAAGAAICDFQAKGDLAMCLFAERPSLTRARLDKFADENVIHYTDRPFFPLTETARPPERKLLVYRHPRPLKKHERRNLWLDCFAEVRRRIRAGYDFKPEVPMPIVHSHLWDGEYKRLGKTWHEAMINALPTFAKLGFKAIYTHGVWEGVTGDPNELPGSICTPYAFRYDDRFGGNEGMKRLIDAAHALGMEVFQWAGFQFSKFSPMWKEHPEWLLREQNGDPWDGGYQILQCGRMRTGFREHVLEQLKKVKDDTGLDNLFYDSYQNLGVTCVDWQAPDKAPQADEIWTLQSELQKYGFKFRCEVVTIFGVSQVGIYSFKGDSFRRRLWEDTVRNDEAFAQFDTSPAFHSDPVFTEDRVSPRLYFWLAGHRAIPGMGADPWHGQEVPGGDLAEEYGRVNHLYNAALPHMHRLRVTEGGKYALWLNEDDQPAVIWAFEDAEMGYTGPVAEVETDARFQAEGQLRLEAGHVYRLG